MDKVKKLSFLVVVIFLLTSILINVSLPTSKGKGPEDSIHETDPGTPPQGMQVYSIGNESWKDPDCRFGTVLNGGGTEQVSAMRWMTNRTLGGDFVVIRTDDSDGYQDFIYNKVGYVDSCHTLVINKMEYANSSYTQRVISNAEGLWIAGGNQTEYYDLWKDTKVEKAIESLIENRSAVIGGTSAGMSVLGDIDYIPETYGIRSSEALNDPYHDYMKDKKDDFIDGIPHLDNVITDTHLSERDRIGRTITFLARNIRDNMSLVEGSSAIACDESTTVCIDENGTAKIYGWDGYTDYAFFINAKTGPNRCEPGKPLHWKDAVDVYKVKGTPEGKNTFDLDNRKGSGGEREQINVINGTLDNYIQEPDTDSSLVADAGVDRTVGMDDSVIFDASNSTDDVSIDNYTWIIDGKEYYGKKIQHSFRSLGRKKVFLKITDSEGNYDTDSIIVTVKDVSGPTADAGEDKTVDEDTVVTFDGSDSFDNIGIVNYTWTIEGEEYYGMVVNHTFVRPGEYTVEVNVTDGAGNNDEDEITVIVMDTTSPIVDAGKKKTVKVGEEFTLDGSNSSDNIGIVSYRWDMEDGQTRYGENVTCSYEELGIYQIILTVEDDAGNKDSASINVTVKDLTPPEAIIDSQRTNVTAGEEVTLDGSESSDNVNIANYTWIFSDVKKHGSEVTLSFEKEGTYQVVLKVKDGSDNVDEAEVTIEVGSDLNANGDDSEDEEESNLDISKEFLKWIPMVIVIAIIALVVGVWYKREILDNQ